MHLQPKAITAALVGLEVEARDVPDATGDQRAIAEEPLSAIIPGAAAAGALGAGVDGRNALSVISAMVVATALLGMVTIILTSLNERRREMAILRSVGARPATILGLLVVEGAFLTLTGVALGAFLLCARALCPQARD